MRTQKRIAEPKPTFIDQRRHPRYKIEVPIQVYPRERHMIRGHTVDISESGISVILVDGAPIDEIVRLEFTVAFGVVEILAIARQRNAFRYGFEFLEDPAAQEIIRRTCRHLAMEEALFRASES